MEHIGWSMDSDYNPQKYKDAAFAAMHSTKCTEVAEDEYWEKFECLPPIMVEGGWLVMEAYTDCEMGPVHSMYARIGGRYYAKWVVRGRPETYIKHVANAYPINPIMAEVAKRQREQWV